MFLALLIGSATLGAAYNVVRLRGDLAARSQFERDPSCHPAGYRQIPSGACTMEPVHVISDLRRRLGRSGPYFAMEIESQDGATEEFVASDAMAGQIKQLGAPVGRLIFHGKTAAYLSGPIVDGTEDSPSAAVVARQLAILYWVLIGALFGFVSWLRFRVHARDYDSEHHSPEHHSG